MPAPCRRNAIASLITFLNGTISGILRVLLVHQTSWAHISCCRPPAVFYRTEPTLASVGSWNAHRQIFGSRRPYREELLEYHTFVPKMRRFDGDTYDRLRYCLAHSIDLRRMATSGNFNSDVHIFYASRKLFDTQLGK